MAWSSITGIGRMRSLFSPASSRVRLHDRCRRKTQSFSHRSFKAGLGTAQLAFTLEYSGVLRRGGTVVVGDAAPEAVFTDLTAFKQVLAIAATKLLGP